MGLSIFSKRVKSTGAVKVGPFKSEARTRGDRARDAQDWSGAAEHYRVHLASVPTDAAIWVQLGHSLKEQKDFSGAEVAYGKAVQLAPQDSDVHLQLGHLLKITGRSLEAAEAYRGALKAGPSDDAYFELRSLGYGDEADQLSKSWETHAGSTIRYIETHDFIETMRLHSTVSGIPRVVLGLIAYILNDLPPEQRDNYRFVHLAGDADELAVIPKNIVQRILSLATAPSVDHPALIEALDSARQKSRLTRLKKGDVYFIPGGFWMAAGNPSFFQSLKRQGVLIGTYVYDLIPITHPEYCESVLTDAFTLAFAETAPFFDFVLTISDYVAKDVTRFLTANGLRKFPAIPVPLAHEMELKPIKAHGSFKWGEQIQKFKGLPFILCVSTIEARKNHIYLYYIWKRLIDEGIDMPDLICVGRYGWRINDLIAQLQTSRYLDGKIHVLHGLSDGDLATLYEHCQFTVFPSFVEGWGLPVGESLARGKVAVASNTSSIPEVGGDFAIYIDPQNLHTGLDAIRKLVTDKRYLAEREANIRKNFKARTWHDTAKEFFARLEEQIAASRPIDDPISVPSPTFNAGEILVVGSLSRPLADRSAYIRSPLRLAFHEGWRPLDAGGAWLRNRTAALRFATDCAPGTEVTIYLSFASVEWAEGLTLRIKPSAALYDKPLGKSEIGGVTREVPRGAHFWCKLKGRVDSQGCLGLDFIIDGPIRANPPEETRVLAVRLYRIGYSPSTDTISRLEMLEDISFGLV